jgi:hypothetical protein
MSLPLQGMGAQKTKINQSMPFPPLGDGGKYSHQCTQQ